MKRLRKHTSSREKHFRPTALTLLMRDGKPYYQAIGGMGMDSILVNAETGKVLITPPPKSRHEVFSPSTFLLLCRFVAGYVFNSLFGSGVSFSRLRNIFKLRLLVWRAWKEKRG